ncbi:hypothetical protein GCM10010198_38850 [Nocardia seriolae]
MQVVSKTPSAAERAYHEIKERILSGKLPGGELISENEMAGELGTSRTPVREAFLRLETEGWMRLYPKRGALVVPAPSHEAEHVIHARYVVETGAVDALTRVARAGLIPGCAHPWTASANSPTSVTSTNSPSWTPISTASTWWPPTIRCSSASTTRCANASAG